MENRLPCRCHLKDKIHSPPDVDPSGRDRIGRVFTEHYILCKSLNDSLRVGIELPDVGNGVADSVGVSDHDSIRPEFSDVILAFQQKTRLAPIGFYRPLARGTRVGRRDHTLNDGDKVARQVPIRELLGPHFQANSGLAM